MLLENFLTSSTFTSKEIQCRFILYYVYTVFLYVIVLILVSDKKSYIAHLPTALNKFRTFTRLHT